MTAAAPLVTVVIPTRNRLPFVQEAIVSVLTQSLEGIELLVVDDASSDGTWEWLSRRPDTNLRAIRLDRLGGQRKAQNCGLAHARGDFVMFLDDDDRLRAGAVERLVTLLSREPGAVAVVGARWRFVEWGDAVRIPHPRRPARRVVWPDLLFGWSAVSGQVLYRTAAVKRVGGFGEDLDKVEDRYLWLRVARLGPVLLDPRIALEYRVHEGQSTGSLPPDIVQMRERIFARFSDDLPGEDRARARRIRIAGRAAARAEDAFASERYGEALIQELRAMRAAPFLYRSPLIGAPRLLRLARSARGLLRGRRR